MGNSISDTSVMKNSGDWLSLQSAAQQELARRNPSSLADWSLAYRLIQGKAMRLIPALLDLYSDTHPFIVVQKAAQVFVTEYLVNTSLWVADTGQGNNGTALYIMPTAAQVNDFSQARVDRAIDESPYIRGRIAPRPPGRAGPVRQGLKKVGRGYIYFRGSDARQLISVPADAIMLDEYDLMEEDVLPRAIQRLAASSLQLVRVASTPRFPEAGINTQFLESDQRYFFIKCPGCGRGQRLEWEHNVDHKRELVVCRHKDCRKPMDLWGSGHWEATVPGNDRVHGYHLNRLYSPLANIPQLIYESTASTPSAIQEFQNSVLGETFSPPGGRISFGELDACRIDYTMPDGSSDPTYMGVDVGNVLHVVIRTRPDANGHTRAVFLSEVASFDDLDALMTRFNVRRCVVDAHPDHHRRREFTLRWRKQAWAAYYDRHAGHEWASRGGEAQTSIVHVDRTLAIEEMSAGFHAKRAGLPRDARRLGGRVRDGYGEYFREMTALTRTLEQDVSGNWVSRYVDNGKADHYAHAETYCMLAGKPRPGGKILRVRRF